MIGQTLTLRPADNPFASVRIDALTYRFSHGGVEEILDRLSRHGGRGCIVGPHGSGKTTLLEQVVAGLEKEIAWVRLSAEIGHPLATALEGLPRELGFDHAVIVDGAEQLGPWSWWRLHRRVRKAGAVVITNHNSGRLPMLYQCATDPTLLAELVNELAPDATDTVDLDELFQRHDGNIRLCFRELYDLWTSRGP